MPIMLEWRRSLLHMRASLKRNSGQSTFHCIAMDFLSIPEYVIKKGRPHGHRYGKRPEDKEYHLAHNLKKRRQKMDIKKIHDRFLRDHAFRERMIENNRDEEVVSCMGRSCRTRSHLSYVRIRILSLQTKLKDKEWKPASSSSSTWWQWQESWWSS